MPNWSAPWNATQSVDLPTIEETFVSKVVAEPVVETLVVEEVKKSTKKTDAAPTE
jgi:hypothetical protein